MKKIFGLLALTIGLCSPNSNLYAQVSNCAVAWKATIPHKTGALNYPTPDGKYVIGSSNKEVTVLDAGAGTVLWTKNFEQDFNIKKINNQVVKKDLETLFICEAKGKNEIIHSIDLATGKRLWSTEEIKNPDVGSATYVRDLDGLLLSSGEGLMLIDLANGQRKWTTDRFTGSIGYQYYDAAAQELFILNYKTGFSALFSGFKNQILSISVQNGFVNWDQKYFGVIHKDPLSGRAVLNMQVDKDKIYLMIEGLQVIDRQTGKDLWTTQFQLFDSKVVGGAPLSHGYKYIYGGVAYPLVSDDAVYLVYNKQTRAAVKIQKLNKETGKLIWEHKVSGRNTPVADLQLRDGRLIAQLGAKVREVSPKKVTGIIWIHTARSRWEGPFGALALNAETGKVDWEFKKASKRITNLVQKGGTLYFADAKSLFQVDPATGSVRQTTPLSQLKAAGIYSLLPTSDRLYLVSESGISAYDYALSSQAFWAKTAKSEYHSEARGNLFLAKHKNGIDFVNLESGKVVGTLKNKKGLTYQLVDDGSGVFTSHGREVIRYKFN